MKCVHSGCKQDPCYDDAAWHMQIHRALDADKNKKRSLTMKNNTQMSVYQSVSTNMNQPDPRDYGPDGPPPNRPKHIHGKCPLCDCIESSRKELLETIRWMAQTVHQAHHEKGTFMECPKNTCDAATQAIAHASPEGK